MQLDTPRPHRLAALVVAAMTATVVLDACGTDDDAGSPPATNAPTTDTPTTDIPTTDTPTTDTPATDTPTTVPEPGPDQRYETIQAVIDDGTGPQLCSLVMESLPPQCGLGVPLVGWSWDAIDVEQVSGDTTWVDQIHVVGTFDPSAGSFGVEAVRLPTDADRERILGSRAMPDHSVPCDAPSDGWPPRTQEWPAEEVAALDGYAGAWSSDPGVVTVKFVGDLDAAEAAVRELYTDPLCVVSAERTEAELSAIQEQLASMSSIQFVSTSIVVDATGEWIDAVVVAPDPARQAAFDDEFGEGVVRLTSLLVPVTDG